MKKKILKSRILLSKIAEIFSTALMAIAIAKVQDNLSFYTPRQNVWSVLVCMVYNGPSRSRRVTPMMMPRPCPSSSRLLKTIFKSHHFFIMEK